MSSIIEISKKSASSKSKITVGDNTVAFMNSQTRLSEEGKEIIVDEAIKILKHCIKPGEDDTVTNIAIGYVQSGKTLSFTTLTALAADNGYRIVVYLTGTKNNLQDQTSKRLRKDLDVQSADSSYIIVSMEDSDTGIESLVKNILSHSDEVLLFPILKHYLHINYLASIFERPALVPILKNIGVIIVDDEADQSSFNTYAKKNASRPDWEEDDFSRTYASILALKQSLPSHSYIQYTATPQAALLIDSNDILSPKYHTVLTPGQGYTGGKFFFKNDSLQLINIIPEAEIYHNTRNRLESIPESLIYSLQEFFISLAVVVFIQKRESFLSMMIHVDGLCDTNTTFARWTQATTQQWIDALTSPDDDFAKIAVVNSFRPAYKSICKYVKDAPSFEQVMAVIVKAMMRTKIHLIQSKGGNLAVGQSIDWDSQKGHILVGADMLNRGFTIEHLSMSYMPRTTRGKSNADTIEQRCRFFGYKMNYIDVCRIYLSTKSLIEYNDYVEHEEILRASLNQCESLEEFSKQSKAMVLADTLNPTRSNILSAKLVRNKLSGWKQMVSLACVEKNKGVFMSILKECSTLFVNCKDYDGNPIRNHRYAKIDIDRFIQLFKQIGFADVPNITRRNVTIQYLVHLRDELNIKHVYVYEMAYAAESAGCIRSHGISSSSTPYNLQYGRAPKGEYPGDKDFKQEDSISFQIHHIKIDQNLHPLNNKDLYNLAIYYPDNLASAYVGFEEDDDEEL